MTKRGVAVLSGLLALLVAGCAAQKISETDAPRMDAQVLHARLADPEMVLLDVRAGSPDPSGRKITGSITEDPDAVAEWAKKYPKDKTLVLYCS